MNNNVRDNLAHKAYEKRINKPIDTFSDCQEIFKEGWDAAVEHFIKVTGLEMDKAMKWMAKEISK